jgi:hypothetical protein
MSLANALAVTQAATSLVLLGDPQQLDQPQKGVHPEGAEVSALEHLLSEHKTMPPERGVFLPETRRFGSKICDFTSEVFYEGRLAPWRDDGTEPRKDLERQRPPAGPSRARGYRPAGRARGKPKCVGRRGRGCRSASSIACLHRIEVDRFGWGCGRG